MFNGLKMVACGLATVCFVSAAGALGTKASDNTLIGDFNGDGKEEIIYYEPNVKYLDEDKPIDDVNILLVKAMKAKLKKVRI